MKSTCFSINLHIPSQKSEQEVTKGVACVEIILAHLFSCVPETFKESLSNDLIS